MSLHELSIVEALSKLKSRELSSLELVNALLQRADEVDPKVRALVHRFDDAARTRARAIDEARARGEDVGPLGGLPLTIKESMATRGVAVTLGLEARRDRVASNDAVVVELLKRAGAIVIAKTNVSQLLLFHESENALFGQTKNPWQLERVPGGSSGGEAAAIAAGESLGGVGTDIGGSIRVPCAFTGIAGFKPTVDRWSNVGSSTALMGQEVIRGQCGPMARRAEDVALLFRAIDGPMQAALDPAVPPLPIGDPGAVDISKLRIGYYKDDGFFVPARSVQRAVEESVAHLKAAGAELVEFSPPDVEAVIDTYFAALSSDGGKTVDRALAGEPPVPQLAQLKRIAGMAPALRRAAAIAMGFSGEARVKRLLEVVSEKPVARLWELTAERTRLRNAAFAAWKGAGIDALICPAHATPALRHRDAGDFSLAGCYSMRYNFLNFPAGVVPVSKVRADETRRPKTDDRLDKKAERVEAGSEGLPLGVQVVGLPYQDELVLAVMIALEAKARLGSEFPHTPVTP